MMANLQDRIAAFAAERIAPRDFNGESSFPLDLWQAMAEEGLFRIGLPERFGGSGASYAAIAEADRVLAEHGGSPGFAMSWAGHQLVARFFIEGFGSATQQAAYLPALAAGRVTAAVAISEPGAGAHPKHLKTTATRAGEDFVLEGGKAYVTNGPIAELFIVLAITAAEAGRKRYSAFLVPRGTPGLSQTEGPKIDFLRPSPHCGLRFAGCRVPRAAMLGAEGTAYETMAGPFRDVEDAVGTGGLAGSLQYLLRLMAATLNDGATDETAAALGELRAFAALVDHGARAVVTALNAGRLGDGDAPATLAGIRSLAVHMLVRAKAIRETFGGCAHDKLDALLRDLDKSLAIAKGPRLVKQTKLGSALLGKRP